VEDAVRQAFTVLRDADREVRLVLWQESTLRVAERLMRG
jgi:hypothetical protein